MQPSRYASDMLDDAARRAITPLRLIFWGGLLCIFDVSFTQTSNGQGFRCDVLNDVVGAVLVAAGVARLGAVPVHDRYASVMKVVLVVAVLAVLDTIREVFVMPWPTWVEFVAALLGVANVASIVAFCVCMRWFCERAGLVAPALSWRVTTTLFVAIYLVPLGLFYAASAVAIASGTSFNANLGPWMLLLVPVCAVPLVHLFVSTSRMKRAAESTAPPAASEFA